MCVAIIMLLLLLLITIIIIISLQQRPHPPPLSRPRYDIFSGAAHITRPYKALKICHTGGSVVGVGAREQALWNKSAFDMVQLFNQKQIRASLWKKCSFKGFVKKTPEKRTFIPQPGFSFFC